MTTAEINRIKKEIDRLEDNAIRMLLTKKSGQAVANHMKIKKLKNMLKSEGIEC